MTIIKCKIMRSHNCPGAAGETAYPRTIAYNTLKESDFTKLVSDTRNLTQGEVKAVLTGAAEVLATYLSVGHSVQVEGLGTFSLSMKGDVKPDKKGTLQLDGAKIKTVNFMPSKQIKRTLGDIKFELVSHEINDAARLNTATAMKIATSLCQNKGLFSSNDFASYAGISYTYARKILLGLVESGALAESRFGRLCLYGLSKKAV